ncbi:MAG: MFS transporter [Flavobacteriaceae bacterium]|mgnify:FL=1|nr:MFS transporter [Flavobacteriaceae bacterium]
MEAQFGGSALNQKTILNHPIGLFVLFFTEMWERFSYYGMRAILVLFLTSSIMNDGWAWSNEDALQLYALYTGLVYLTPILGGFLADKFLGYRNATVLGALIMTLGHASMALETFTHSFFYIGLVLLIIGNGFFKPNISSIVGQLYKEGDKRKDGGYTIFYMGINAGAFLGILLCGYIGENIGWHLGFGLAGIFMFLGMLQFWYAQKIFGNIGLTPKKLAEIQPTSKGLNVKTGFTKVEIDRLIVVVVFSIFTIFFWWAFEQAGGSMTIFAKDFTQRTLVGDASLIFKLANTIITLVPMVVLTIVLYGLFSKMLTNFMLSNLFLGASFVIIWAIVIWMIKREFSESATEIPASWFSVLNSLYIILLAPLFSKIWSSNLNPSGPIKFAIGLILLGIGFAFLAFGAWGIPLGAEQAGVSIIWLILAYLFHTMGELCISPVGLSYVSKLAPVKLVGLMFGFWFVCSAIANFLGGQTGSYIDKISEAYGLSNFFLIFFVIPVLAGILMILLKPILIKKMHGID